MTAPQTKKPGGLSLGKLINSVAVAQPVLKPDTELDLAKLFSTKQIRKKFDNLEDLAQTIRLNGIVEPLVVHEEADGRYRIIVGERRFRAAPLASLTKVPVVIRRGLSELEIRRMQVTENNDREPLTAFEEAMGVIEDVELYGTQAAMTIWNRSEPWINKRVGTARYAEQVRALLENELCGDFEVLQSLNQLHAVSRSEFDAMVQRLRSGAHIGRDDVREKVAAAKKWKAQDKENQRSTAGEKTPTQRNDSERGDEAEPLHGPTATDTEPAKSMKLVADKTVTSQSKGTGSAPTQRQRIGVGSDPIAGGHDRKQAEEALRGQREALMLQGESLGDQLHAMQSRMAEMQYSLAEGEWALWTTFLDSLLPMLAALGKDRTRAYLRRLQVELKSADANAIWEQLHPGAANGGDAGPAAVAKMPDGWTF